MAWLLLVVAGIFECIWATTMKMSDGFTRAGWSVATIVGMIISFWGLIMATKQLPIGIAYPVWTGIGAVGSVLIGCIIFKDKMNPATWVFVVLLVVSIIGIKITSGK